MASASVPLQIAVDGPVASGKSTICAALALRLGIMYLDTGVMYRSVAYAAITHHIDLTSDEACGLIAETMNLQIIPATIDDGRQATILLNDEDITWAIRESQVNAIVSQVAAHPRVRAAMRQRQRDIAARHSIVMAGRDIAAIVLPQAQVKIFLDASIDERVRRRCAEIAARHPERHIDLNALRAEVMQRDAIDSTQMQLTSDTIMLMTDGLSIGQVIDKIVEVVHERYP